MRFAVLLVLIAVTGGARADDLERARQLEVQLEYEQALAIVDEILARGGADPARYVELQMFGGKLAGGLDRDELAEQYFARAIAVKPDVALPEGTSPKIATPFLRARGRKYPLLVSAHAKQGLVTLEVGDAIGIVRGIAVRVQVGDKHADLVERSARSVMVGPDAKILQVAALDVAGNQLWVGTIHEEPVVVVPPRRELRPRIARWSTWAIATGVVASATAIAAWRFSVAQDEFDRRRADGITDFTELRAIEDRGKRWGLGTNVGLGVTAATGIATIVFALRGSTRIVVTPGPGTGIGMTARF